jgi:hypothetical protein
MQADDVEALVRRQIEEFRYTAPSTGTIGVPWSADRVAAEVERLRTSLIRPQLATVEIADYGSPGPRRALWLVTRTLENGYLVVFDSEARAFGLAVSGEVPPPQTVAVWGDLVSTFMAR